MIAAAISFGVSFVGILSLIAFKRWERVREPALYRKYRVVLDRYSMRFVHFARNIPREVRITLSRVGHTIVLHISAFVLQIVRFVERKLFKFVNMVKGRHEIHHKKGSTSLFLTSISDRKEHPQKEG